MPSRRARNVAIAAVVAAGVAAVAVALWRSDGGAPGPGPAPPGPAGALRAVAPGAPAAAARPEALSAGETLRVESSSLVAGALFAIDLAVPAPPPEVMTLTVSVFAEDGRSIELLGRVVADDRERTTVAIDGGWLARPGRYVVQVKTAETSHFPVRRYAIEVR